MAASPAMGRPKIEGLVRFPLRLLGSQLKALESLCERERIARGDPGLTVTDVMREAFATHLAAHPAPKPKRPRKVTG